MRNFYSSGLLRGLSLSQSLPLAYPAIRRIGCSSGEHLRVIARTCRMLAMVGEHHYEFGSEHLPGPNFPTRDLMYQPA